MKIIFFIILFSLHLTNTQGQDSGHPFFFDVGMDIGVGINNARSTFIDKPSSLILTQFKLSYKIKERHSVGVSYSILSSPETATLQFQNVPPTPDSYISDIKFQKAGIHYGFLVFEKKDVHLNIGGSLNINQFSVVNEIQSFFELLNFGSIEPAAEGSYSFSEFFSLGLRLSYPLLIITDSQNYMVDQRFVQQPYAGIFMRLGGF